MSFTQDFRTQRRNYNDGTTRAGDHDRLWYDGGTKTIRVYDEDSDGNPIPGGTIIAGAAYISEGIEFSNYPTFDDLTDAVEATFSDSDYVSETELTSTLSSYATTSYVDSQITGLSYWEEDSIGSLIPDSDAAYDIGSPTHRVRDLYVSSNSIHVGDYVLSENAGVLHWNGEPAVSSGSLHVDNHSITVSSSGDLELDGTALATVEYVDGSVSGLASAAYVDASVPDLEPYATTAYVDTQISNITLDSTAYIDQTELNAATANGNTAFGWGNHSTAGYLTTEISHADVLVDGDFSSAGIMKTDGAGTYSILTDNSTNWNTAYSWGDHGTAGYTSYANSDVDAHLNQSNPTDGYVLSWTSGDYAWVAQTGGGGGGTDTVVAPFAFIRVTANASTSGTAISHSTFTHSASDCYVDFTFDTAQANTNYHIITDYRNDNEVNYTIDITNQATTGFRANFYDQDNSYNSVPIANVLSASPTFIVYAETPTTTITGSNLSNASINDLGDVSISSATTGQVLKYNGSSWVNDTDAGASSRSTATGTTGSLADAAEADLDITGFKSYMLLTITTDRAARVRLYVSAATRTADASRAEGVDPTSDAGLIAEVITTGAETVIISPGAYGFNLEGTPTTTIPCRVTNKSGITSTVQVDLNILQLEA